jgi:hypothetical protein
MTEFDRRTFLRASGATLALAGISTFAGGATAVNRPGESGDSGC